MCLTPISLFHRTVLYHEACSYVSYEVPCSKCEECRSVQRLEWETRLAFELAYTKQHGGTAVFLTFTYNDEHLPWLMFRDGLHYCKVPCFDGDHVLNFLDQVNNYMQKFYGKESYKYFMAAEYGKNTRRPHYHGLFMIRKGVDWHNFVEMCRQYWIYGRLDSEHEELGFMFPKFDYKRNTYVDSHGQSSTPLLKGFDPNSGVPLYAGAKYVSKYVTKDLSYFRLNPLLEKAYKEDKKFKKTYRRWLPKHWQSNGIGYSIFKDIDLSNIEAVDDLIQNGIVNPLDPSKPRMALPTFVVNKLMYKNVLSDRVSPTTGKRLYDRELSTFGFRYLKQSYINKVNRVCKRMSETFQWILQNEDCFPLRHNMLNLQWCSPITDVTDYEQLRPIAIYHVLLKHLSPLNLSRSLWRFDGRLSSFLDIDKSYSLYFDAKTKWRVQEYIEDGISEEYTSQDAAFFNEAFYEVRRLDEIFCDTSRRLATCRCKEFVRKQEQRDYTRYLFKYRYDKRLC